MIGKFKRIALRGGTCFLKRDNFLLWESPFIRGREREFREKGERKMWCKGYAGGGVVGEAGLRNFENE